jgi:plasmid stabilization system protein ParE
VLSKWTRSVVSLLSRTLYGGDVQISLSKVRVKVSVFRERERSDRSEAASVSTRELVVANTPYLVPYRVRNNVVEILRVFHGARKWPQKF